MTPNKRPPLARAGLGVSPDVKPAAPEESSLGVDRRNLLLSSAAVVAASTLPAGVAGAGFRLRGDTAAARLGSEDGRDSTDPTAGAAADHRARLAQSAATGPLYGQTAEGRSEHPSRSSRRAGPHRDVAEPPPTPTSFRDDADLHRIVVGRSDRLAPPRGSLPGNSKKPLTVKYLTLVYACPV
jgi:hypothetical protein